MPTPSPIHHCHFIPAIRIASSVATLRLCSSASPLIHGPRLSSTVLVFDTAQTSQTLRKTPLDPSPCPEVLRATHALFCLSCLAWLLRLVAFRSPPILFFFRPPSFPPSSTLTLLILHLRPPSPSGPNKSLQITPRQQVPNTEPSPTVKGDRHASGQGWGLFFHFALRGVFS